MKNRIKTVIFLLVLMMLFVLSSLVDTKNADALKDYVDPDGNVYPGWSLVGSNTDKKTWYFVGEGEEGEVGDIAGCYGLNGDLSPGTVTNFAIRNIPIKANDTYEVSATFKPWEDMVKEGETRESTYGIVAWYQDANNYLIYWLQTKGTENQVEDAGITVGAWSGNLYGMVNGARRAYHIPSNYCSDKDPAFGFVDSWRTDEFYDLWYDQSQYTHSTLLKKKSVLLKQDTVVTLKVKSSLTSYKGEACRQFELIQIVNGVAFTSCVQYIRGVTGSTGDFYTGIGVKKFNCDISNFSISATNTNFTSSVESKLNALPSTVTSVKNVESVVSARGAYNGLLSLKSKVASSAYNKLVAAEKAAAKYIEGKINALNMEDPGDAFGGEGGVYELYNFIANDYIRAYISSAAVEKYKQAYIAFGHDCEFVYSKDATQHWGKCSVCGDESAKTNHNFNKGVVTKETSCEGPGIKTYTCKTCDYQKTEEIPQISHTPADSYNANDDTHWYFCSSCYLYKIDEEAHDYDSGLITKAATCTETGLKVYTCSICNYEKEEEIEMLEHNYSSKMSYDKNNHWYACTLCSAVKEDSILPHQWDDGKVTEKATCKKAGVMTYTCSCGATKTETINKIDHNYSSKWTYDDDYHWHLCTICNEAQSDFGSHEWDSGVVTKEPTEYEDGVKTYTCSCLATKTEVIYAVNHVHKFDESIWNHDANNHWHPSTCGHADEKDSIENHTWNSGVVTKEPTCSTTGIKLFTCTVCSATKEESIANGSHVFEENYYDYNTTYHWLICTLCDESNEERVKHTFDSGVITLNPTCTAEGVKTYSCECGYQKTESINVIPHNWSTVYSSNETYHWHVCQDCNEMDIDNRERHSFGSWEVDEEATCTSKGREVRVCSECNYEATREIDEVEHEFSSEWNSDNRYHWHECENCDEVDDKDEHYWNKGVVTKEPTTLEEGVKTYTCEDCGKTKTEAIDKLTENISKPDEYDSNGGCGGSVVTSLFGLFALTSVAIFLKKKRNTIK